jgi:hypothetical protein
MILRRITIFVWALSMLMCVERISAQSGNAGSVEGTVKDPSGAAVGRAVGGIQLAVRQRTGGRSGAGLCDGADV